jgi:hypothetical protein
MLVRSLCESLRRSKDTISLLETAESVDAPVLIRHRWWVRKDQRLNHLQWSRV